MFTSQFHLQINFLANRGRGLQKGGGKNLESLLHHSPPPLPSAIPCCKLDIQRNGHKWTHTPSLKPTHPVSGRAVAACKNNHLHNTASLFAAPHTRERERVQPIMVTVRAAEYPPPPLCRSCSSVSVCRTGWGPGSGMERPFRYLSFKVQLCVDLDEFNF